MSSMILIGRVSYVKMEEDEPDLFSELGSGHIVITWPAAESGFTLEYTTNLKGGAGFPATGVEATNGATRSVTVPSDGVARFFRLRQ